MINIQLTEHFTLAEFTHSDMALRRGVDNTPDGAVLSNLQTHTAPGLEQARVLLAHPIYISSGFRSRALNRMIGGSHTSAHVTGMAVDFVCPGYGSPREVATRLSLSDIEFDQLIYEGRWVHMGFAYTPRRQLLTAHFKNGGVSYTQGIA